MLNFDARVKNSDAAQPRVTNVKTPFVFLFHEMFGSLGAFSECFKCVRLSVEEETH